MPGKIGNHFRILLAQKATKQQQNITLMDVQRETGIVWSTPNSWVNNQVTRHDAPVIKTLCEYFDCQVGDLLVFKNKKFRLANDKNNSIVKAKIMTLNEVETRRLLIAPKLEAAGWILQDRNQMNLFAGRGIAVREFPLETAYADYMLFVDRKAVGVVEAKAEGTTHGGVAEQSASYLVGLPVNIPHVQLPLPFAYESNGVEVYFRNERDPQPRS